ncbi:hypothetical protein TvY486_0018220 [Trypanosoma vivax Y486]|uniref:Uncharacterized protein n=1 Tax=Trypanosoma vivax (strain Y486) TaxID=1055687 RepID=F9WNJ6_TRYVY|nr:hypothetical protein TvY486_0018220 [Trypanosoma vivax Y486]|eukprot:CCD19114.1 hypothetical protein TvY486_0018220 [Trypanosoma vivax Y486]
MEMMCRGDELHIAQKKKKRVFIIVACRGVLIFGGFCAAVTSTHRDMWLGAMAVETVRRRWLLRPLFLHLLLSAGLLVHLEGNFSSKHPAVCFQFCHATSRPTPHHAICFLLY